MCAYYECLFCLLALHMYIVQEGKAALRSYITVSCPWTSIQIGFEESKCRVNSDEDFLRNINLIMFEVSMFEQLQKLFGNINAI